MADLFTVDECGEYIDARTDDQDLREKIRDALSKVGPQTMEEIDRIASEVVRDHFSADIRAFAKGLRRPFVV